MSKLSMYAFAFVACLGTTAMLGTTNRAVTANQGTEAHLASDGAFRDGLYLGKLAAASGQRLRPAIGRWSNQRDRSMFTAGYWRGYGDSLASTANAADKD